MCVVLRKKQHLIQITIRRGAFSKQCHQCQFDVATKEAEMAVGNNNGNSHSANGYGSLRVNLEHGNSFCAHFKPACFCELRHWVLLTAKTEIECPKIVFQEILAHFCCSKLFKSRCATLQFLLRQTRVLGCDAMDCFQISKHFLQFFCHRLPRATHKTTFCSGTVSQTEGSVNGSHR